MSERTLQDMFTSEEEQDGTYLVEDVTRVHEMSIVLDHIFILRMLNRECLANLSEHYWKYLRARIHSYYRMQTATKYLLDRNTYDLLTHEGSFNKRGNRLVWADVDLFNLPSNLTIQFDHKYRLGYQKKGLIQIRIYRLDDYPPIDLDTQYFRNGGLDIEFAHLLLEQQGYNTTLKQIIGCDYIHDPMKSYPKKLMRKINEYLNQNPSNYGVELAYDIGRYTHQITGDTPHITHLSEQINVDHDITDVTHDPIYLLSECYKLSMEAIRRNMVIIRVEYLRNNDVSVIYSRDYYIDTLNEEIFFNIETKLYADRSIKIEDYDVDVKLTSPKILQEKHIDERENLVVVYDILSLLKRERSVTYKTTERVVDTTRKTEVRSNATNTVNEPRIHVGDRTYYIGRRDPNVDPVPRAEPQYQIEITNCTVDFLYCQECWDMDIKTRLYRNKQDDKLEICPSYRREYEKLQKNPDYKVDTRIQPHSLRIHAERVVKRPFTKYKDKPKRDDTFRIVK